MSKCLCLFVSMLIASLPAGPVVAEARLDLNTATVDELRTLPEIDEYRAKMIDAYRFTYGVFKSVDELRQVPDITDEIFDRIKDRLYVDPRTMERVGRELHERSEAARVRAKSRLPKGARPRRKVDRPLRGEEAFEEYTDRIKANPKDTEAYYFRSNAYMAENRYGPAMDDLNRAIRLDPKYTDAYRMRAIIHLVQNHSDRAMEDFTRVIRLNPAASDYIHRSTLHLSANRTDSAMADLNAAIRVNPKDAQAYSMRGAVYGYLDHFDSSLQDFDQAFRLDTQNSAIYQNRSGIYTKLGRHREALADLNQAIIRDRRFSAAQFGRCLSYLCLAEWDSAALDAQAALRFGTWQGEYPLYIGIAGHLAYRGAGKPREGEKILTDALKKYSKKRWPHPVIRYLRNEITAQHLLSRANDTGQLTEAHAYIGLDLSLKGRPAEASEHLRWVKEHGDRNFNEYPLAAAELRRIETLKLTD